MSLTHNKNLLLDLLVNCIFAKFALETLSLKGKCTFLLLNVLIIGLCNSSANSLLEIISFLTVLPYVFFNKKIYKRLKQVHVGIYHIVDF